MRIMQSIKRGFAVGGAVAIVTAALTTGTGPLAATAVAGADTPAASCQMGNGIQHVIEITFDNVHFNRDNPNVLSDLEQMPALENFITGNGTLLSNNHTPLIAHTADDTITNYSGLYGDRQGLGITNTYETYTGSAIASSSAFAYWTAASADSFPNQPYSATVPATDPTSATPPAPWVPFTRAGCNVGEVATSNSTLENLSPDISNVFGPSSPEQAQLTADTSQYKDQETNDYVGLGVHCAQGSSFCANAQAVKYGQTTPSPAAVADQLPSEPGGYTGYQALYGHKYLQPVLAGAANSGGNRVIGSDSFPVTDAAGNLTDLGGHELDGQYSDASGPGFPGYGPITASQSLSYVADMQETGVPVTYAYISDVHEVKAGDAGPCSPASTYKGNPDVGYPDGPGDNCYYQTTAAYNQAFQTFFQRLADDGINKSNTLFVFAADEGDHFSGANVGRSSQPSCTGTPGTTSYICSYASGQIGEQEVAVHGLLSNQQSDSASFYNEPQGNAVYMSGNPSPTSSATRQLERDFGNASANDSYDGQVEKVVNYEADPTVEQLLHFTNADPNRTPTFTVFPKADFYLTAGLTDAAAGFSCSSGVNASNAATKCSSVYSKYAWNHGYYAPEIDNTWLGLVGPGVANKGIDGSGPAAGPSSAGTDNSAPILDTAIPNTGTWADHTDIRPTIMALTGLKDDYTEDGRVLTEDLTITPGQTADPEFQPLAVCYKQLNSSVGQFGTDVLEADTTALESGSTTDDSAYTNFSSQLSTLGSQRDALATTIKQELWNAEFNNTPLPSSAAGDLTQCNADLASAAALLSPGTGTPEAPWAILLPTLAALMGALVIIVRRRRSEAGA